MSPPQLRLRTTTGDDLAFVLKLEANPDTTPFIIPWSRHRHEQAISAADEAHLLVAEGDHRVGFLLLAGLTSEHRGIELRRIVVEWKGAGIGRRALGLALEHAFRELGAHRVWLDVKTHNQRAQRAYAASGFVAEGTLRDALLTGGSYESLVVMSILSREWAARTGPPSRWHSAEVYKPGRRRKT